MKIAAVALSLLVAAESARAGEVFAVHNTKNELYRFDTTTFAVTLVGAYTLPSGNQAIRGLGLDPDTGELFGLANAPWNGAIVELDPVSGVASGAVPLIWSLSGLLAAAYDPATKRQWWIQYGDPAPIPYLAFADVATGSAIATGTPGDSAKLFMGMAFSPDGSLWAIEWTTGGQLYLLDEYGPFGPGAVPVGQLSPLFDRSEGISLTVDGPVSNGLLAYSTTEHKLYRIDVTTAQTTLIHTFPLSVPRFAAIAGSPCKGAATRYGNGCAGSGGFTPLLKLDGCPAPGSTVEVDLSSGLGGGTAILFLGQQPAALPLGAGCTLLAFPLFPIAPTFALGGAGAGAGAATFAARVPHMIPNGTQLAMQAFVIDGGAPLGASNSNGVEVEIDS